MISKQQLDYLSELEIPRLSEYLKEKTSSELQTLLEEITGIVQSDSADLNKKDKYLTTLTIIQSRINGVTNQEYNSDLVDTSQFTPLTSDDLLNVLGLTIKRDNTNKLITFLCMLSAYTKDAQFNLSFNAPSSSGKSYIPMEIAQLFPAEDVLEVGYCSPTAFFHDKSREYKSDTNELIVDLSHKILIFLDQPHTLLLQHLRPMLSHDKEEIHIKITDKSQKAGLRTKNVILKGFPAVIFCTVGLRIDEQESTRFILLSPEISQEKIREAISEKINRSSNTFSYKYSLEKNDKRQQLKLRIKAIKQERVSEVIIPSPKIVEQLMFERVKILKPRHSRDVGSIISLIKVFALLNVWNREREGSAVITDQNDIKEAFSLWDVISEAQELNLPPYVYTLYTDVILKAFTQKNAINSDEELKIGLSRQEILIKHYEIHGRHLSDWSLRKEILPMLETSGLITQVEDKDDHRKILIYPTTHSTISQEKNNSGANGGVNNQNFIESKNN